MRAYISGDIIAPAHPLTPDWGHGIRFSARAKCVLKARRLKKLGRGSMLGGFAKSTLTESYEMIESISVVVALMLLGFFQLIY